MDQLNDQTNVNDVTEERENEVKGVYKIVNKVQTENSNRKYDMCR